MATTKVLFPESRLMFLTSDGITTITGLNKSFTVENGGEVIADRLPAEPITDKEWELVLPFNSGAIYKVSKITYKDGYHYITFQFLRWADTEKEGR
jgi:hypothetical protein